MINKKGFTLIELMVVVTVMGILMAMAIRILMAILHRSRTMSFCIGPAIYHFVV